MEVVDATDNSQFQTVSRHECGVDTCLSKTQCQNMYRKTEGISSNFRTRHKFCGRGPTTWSFSVHCLTFVLLCSVFWKAAGGLVQDGM